MGNSDDSFNDIQGTDYRSEIGLTWDEVAQEGHYYVEAEQSGVLDGIDPTQAGKNTSDNWA
ncbi:hypothetical protein AA0120_g12635 [Alternaria tenuissima]|nr:hypothetical protein AA0120_g12635 [Alternaria tenuissima]